MNFSSFHCIDIIKNIVLPPAVVAAAAVEPVEVVVVAVVVVEPSAEPSEMGAVADMSWSNRTPSVQL